MEPPWSEESQEPAEPPGSEEPKDPIEPAEPKEPIEPVKPPGPEEPAEPVACGTGSNSIGQGLLAHVISLGSASMLKAELE